MIVTTKQLFTHAHRQVRRRRHNINNARQVMGLFRGNMDSKAPFIIRSRGARSYTDKHARARDPRRRRSSPTRSSPCCTSTTATGHLHGLHLQRLL